MTDYVIPCETLWRLSNVLKLPAVDCDEFFKAIRIDNGIAVATNRKVMACEYIGGASGIIHVIVDPALIDACRKEAPYASKLTITVNEALRFAVAKTTLGYIQPGNCCVWSPGPTDYDRWRAMAMRCAEPAPVAGGGMFWDTETIAALGAASPSGRLMFEQVINCQSRPVLVRDCTDHNWFGLFNAFSLEESGRPATFPNWMAA